ncbi:hypothetical protein AC578_4107 [Pseudocercospora eumusae]|uniref:Uncharacterized protein n=1 Tax=Pseudocercospora eumusae TaxID=321146 RepID=A0A139HFE0_9PEZI|nr:hypothetical protein AC578_4107 [Pseudocercospora eumusae]
MKYCQAEMLFRRKSRADEVTPSNLPSSTSSPLSYQNLHHRPPGQNIIVAKSLPHGSGGERVWPNPLKHTGRPYGFVSATLWTRPAPTSIDANAQRSIAANTAAACENESARNVAEEMRFARPILLQKLAGMQTVVEVTMVPTLEKE